MVTSNDPTLVVSSKPCQSAQTRKKLYLYLFSVEFNELTWMCHFLLFLFCWTICTMLHNGTGIWLHDYSEFAFLHMLTDCSVSCFSKRFLFNILHRM